MTRKIFILLFTIILCTFSFSSAASLFVCQKKSCFYVNEEFPVRPWVKRLYPFFKARNARIDFCEADPKTHACLIEGLNWYSNSMISTAFFSIPVARTLPQKNTLLLDYLVKANESLPSCSFSQSTLEDGDNHTIRFVSHFFSCDILDFGKTQIQNTFYIDYIDFDNAVLGGKYMVQTHGALTSNSAGYALMKFRDGNTLIPLVTEPYYGDIPDVPNSTDLARMNRQVKTATASATQQNGEHPLVTGVSDWWAELKHSFNLDAPSPKTVHEDDHWWTKFTHKFMKVLYFEPLE